MKKFIMALAITLLFSIPAMAAISSIEARHHVGEMQTVCGTVAQVSYLRKGIAINLGKRFPYQHINGFVWNSNALSVVRGFGSYNDLIGRNICISGPIVLYKGRPEIVISTPAQISIR